MGSRSSLEVIQSIINAERYADEGALCVGTAVRNNLPLVTVSRDHGAHGTEIARLLADALGVPCYDRELLKEVVREARADRHLLEQLDEKVIGIMDEMMMSFFSRKATSRDNFFRYMAKVILGICHSGGVIVGRGAHLLIPEHRPVLRVRIEGSQAVCAQRIAQQLGIKVGKAEKIVEKTNHERADFVRKIYERYPTRRTYYDLVINSDLFAPEGAVRVILSATRELGFVNAGT
jgi:cytidylate kinase